MSTRRSFLGALAAPACLPTAGELAAAIAARPGGAPDDEEFWSAVARGYDVDRSVTNFNNGGVSPAPAIALGALKRHLDFANLCPSHNLWRIQAPNREHVRQRLAGAWGCDAEELALTRNASEGLQICLFGIDLQAGDEVVCTTQDYPRMISTLRQRERREGIVLRQVEIPTPCEDPAEVVARYRAALTERTKMILLCHVINLTGQILPVTEVTALGRERGIPVVVDGAHGFAHVPFDFAALDVDYYATSLHKWLNAPVGAGLLYVRRERIGGLWPLMAGRPEQDGDIRKFEEIGTHTEGHQLAVAEALTFHEAIGGARKLARMVWLRDRWAERLRAASPRVRLNTSLRPGVAGGFANVRIEGVDTGELGTHLWNRHRIVTTPIRHDEFEGLRVSPGVYSTASEVDGFCAAIEDVIANGLPS